MLKSKMRRYLNEHVNNRDLQRPDLDRRVSTTRGEVAIHIPDALYRSGVAIREQRRMLHRRPSGKTYATRRRRLFFVTHTVVIARFTPVSPCLDSRECQKV